MLIDFGIHFNYQINKMILWLMFIKDKITCDNMKSGQNFGRRYYLQEYLKFITIPFCKEVNSLSTSQHIFLLKRYKKMVKKIETKEIELRKRDYKF